MADISMADTHYQTLKTLWHRQQSVEEEIKCYFIQCNRVGLHHVFFFFFLATQCMHPAFHILCTHCKS